MKPIHSKNKSPKCPKCGADMVERKRKSDGQPFWGCSNFPRCRGIVNINFGASRQLKSIPNPSSYQKKIFEGVETLIHKNVFGDKKHLIVSAGAGSGKTTTEEHVVGIIRKHNPKASVIYMVYNKHVQVEAQQKGLPAATTHSKFYQDLISYVGKKPKLKEDKVKEIVESLIPETTFNEEGWIVSIVCQIVSKVKNTLAPWNDESLANICDKFGIEINGAQDKIFDFVRQTMELNNKQLDVIDFDDMMYLVWKYKMPVKQYDWVLGDEVQDWNRLQIELVLRSVKPNGHILVVGDKHQSMYGFRGADINAMSNLQEALDAYELPLSISYRCGKKHVDMVNTLFPEIPFEKWNNAKDGTIEQMSSNRMMGEVKDKDLVLCRTNAPLVRPCFALIRRGIKATIRGRDIGKGLVNLIEKFEKCIRLNICYLRI